MRRSSLTPILAAQEPLIVVEETNLDSSTDDAEGAMGGTELFTKRSNSDESDPDSPVNPYLLCPFPDMQQRRKHSLPSLQITEGITARRVRRLSEVGGETGINPKKVEFLATLSLENNPSAGGRRNSVVTISAVPPMLFGRYRRESIAGLSPSVNLKNAYEDGSVRPNIGTGIETLANGKITLTGFDISGGVGFGVPAGITAGIVPGIGLGSRRGSGIVGPPLTNHRGSIHNLQLDIMDGLATRQMRSDTVNVTKDTLEEADSNLSVET